MKIATPDFDVIDSGSIVLLRPNTAAASAWCDEHLPEDATWFGGSVAVEPRYISDIVDGAISDGLTVH